MAGMIMNQPDPWWSPGAPAGRPEPSRAVACGRRRRSADRREAERGLLQSARDMLEQAEPLAEAFTVPPSHSANLAIMRARIAAALFEIDRLQARIENRQRANDPSALAATQLLLNPFD